MKTSATPIARILCTTALAIFFFALGRAAMAATIEVEVGPQAQTMFSPFSVSIQRGDTVKWTWKSSHHSVTAGTPQNHTGLFDSGIINSGSTFSYTFNDPGKYDYHCDPHADCCAMTGVVQVAGSTPTPTPRPPSKAQLLNISTRMQVQTQDRVLIGGFIVTGTDPKRVVLRAIGPSLTSFGVVGALADPVLELHAPGGALITSNDNWRDSQETEIEQAGFAPADDLESAIIATLDPGGYTAIVSGKGATSGVGLVEGYDLDQPAAAQLGNISTRGFVQTNSNVMIGGFILGNGSGTTNVVIRALGPSLGALGVAGALSDPTLELRNAEGTLVQENDNWKETQQAELEAVRFAPQNDLESAMIVTIPTSGFTAIVAGKNGVTGVSLVEVYRLP